MQVNGSSHFEVCIHFNLWCFKIYYPFFKLFEIKFYLTSIFPVMCNQLLLSNQFDQFWCNLCV
jgi:hypothetical protein